VPIDQIEKGIRDATFCFADITLDNANVFFELGYAIACHKPLLMVCEKGLRAKFPFDVQHRTIYHYSTGPSDYRKLQENITARLQALNKTEILLTKLLTKPSYKKPISKNGLSVSERIVISAILGNVNGPSNSVAEEVIHAELIKYELTTGDATTAIQSLLVKRLIGRDIEMRDSRQSAVFHLRMPGIDSRMMSFC